MSKTVKIWLIVAASLTLVGCLILGGVIMAIDWDFLKLSTNKYEAKTYEISEGFTSISVNTNTADVVVVPSEDGTCRVECYEQKNLKYSVTVKEGVLVIELRDTRKWYECIGVNFESSKITVHLPLSEYGTLAVESSTGAVSVKELTFEALDISASTGKITISDVICQGDVNLRCSTGKTTISDVICQGDVNLRCSTGKAEIKNVNCKNLTSKGDTGDIYLSDVIASGKLSITRDTGDVHFQASDAAELFVKTDTGDVKGSLLTDKVFIVRTDTGRIDVPKTVTGGRCEISTDTGNIKISISSN